MPLHARPYPCPGYGVPSAQRSAVLRTGPYRTTRTQCMRASGHHGLGTATDSDLGSMAQHVIYAALSDVLVVP